MAPTMKLPADFRFYYFASTYNVDRAGICTPHPTDSRGKAVEIGGVRGGSIASSEKGKGVTEVEESKLCSCKIDHAVTSSSSAILVCLSSSHDVICVSDSKP